MTDARDASKCALETVPALRRGHEPARVWDPVPFDADALEPAQPAEGTNLAASEKVVGRPVLLQLREAPRPVAPAPRAKKSDDAAEIVMGLEQE